MSVSGRRIATLPQRTRRFPAPSILLALGLVLATLPLPMPAPSTTLAAFSCPCSIWSGSTTPAVASENDPNAVEVGVKFRSSVAGQITGLRFYKGSGNTGTHTGHLWSSTGQLLASATFSGETATGWQQVSFAAPVAVSANTTYVASYFAPAGHYAVDGGYFAGTSVTNGPLTALANGTDGGNGVYLYTSSGGFPNQTYNAENYWVDVVFTDTPVAPGPVISAVQASGITATGATVTWTTDVASDSQVEYGLSTAYGASTALDPTLVTSHTQALSGLASGTLYHYRVKSRDAAANLSTSADFTFTTACDPSRPIACENAKPGNPASQWDLGSVDSTAIEGFATDISVNRGQTVHFKIRTTASSYHIDVYRVGYYQGNGARLLATIPNSATAKNKQPACLSDATTGLVDCGNWAESASWAVPSTAVSGVYLAKLVRDDGTAGANHIPFVVRDDASRSDMLFQTSDTTWQAYNDYGGNSLYKNAAGNLPAGRAYKVSYNRPFNTRNSEQRSFFFNAEYPMVRFLEANGYDVAYQSGIDSDRLGAAVLEQHRTFLSVGHDEYWSGAQRANVEAARGAGVHLAFFSGNEVYWKTRWESSTDGSNTPYRTLVCYKETQADARIDPLDLSNGVWTGTWRDPRFSPPADGGRPENALTGTIFDVQETDGAILVPAADGQMRFWRNTSVASQAEGQTAQVGTDVIGFEWDEELDNGYRPAGLFRLSTTTVGVSQKLEDYGSTVAPGTATHSLTLYRHPSGALVFGAGTIQWSWGLDGGHDRGTSSPDPRIQQATVNLLADMGLQPATLQAGLVAATASADRTPPTSTITSPAAGASVNNGVPVTITGTAADSGGVVAGVEVSTDGGATWHRANGRASWNYTWTPTVLGGSTIRSRAVDDSGNVETPSAGVGVTVQARPCPCSIWNDSYTPGFPSTTGASSVELGVKFRTSSAGYVHGLRFYKGASNTGTHTGHLWTSASTLLASATFTNETATGWQQVVFSSPVAVSANTTYVVSYVAPNGGYAYDEFYFLASGFSDPPLRALMDGEDGPNGVYSPGASGFPYQSYKSTNYWVDPIFSTSPQVDLRPPTISAVQASGITAAGATIGWTTDEPSDSLVEYGTTTAYGLVSTPDPTMVTGHSQPLTGLAAGTLYHYRVKSRDAAGNLATSADATFTTAAASATGTATPTPSATATATRTPSATATQPVATPTTTPTRTPSFTPTATPTPTRTPPATATATPTPSPTATQPAGTPTATAAAPTATPTSTATQAVPTPTATAGSPTPTATPCPGSAQRCGRP